MDEEFRKLNRAALPPALETLDDRVLAAFAVRKAINDLPGNLREIIVLRGIEELSQAETAEMLGVSEKSVETRLYRARAKLRAMLGE